MFGPSAEDLLKVNQHHAANFLALYTVLLDKGIVTAEEFQCARAKAIHSLDQNMAKQREQFLAEHPGIAAFAKIFDRAP